MSTPEFDVDGVGIARLGVGVVDSCATIGPVAGTGDGVAQVPLLPPWLVISREPRSNPAPLSAERSSSRCSLSACLASGEALDSSMLTTPCLTSTATSTVPRSLGCRRRFSVWVPSSAWRAPATREASDDAGMGPASPAVQPGGRVAPGALAGPAPSGPPDGAGDHGGVAVAVPVAELFGADWPLLCAPPPSPPEPGPLLPVPPPEGAATPEEPGPAMRRADALETVGDAAGVTDATRVVGVALAADWAAEVSGIGADGLAPPAVASAPGPLREVPNDLPLPDADWSAGWPAPVPGAGLVAGGGVGPATLSSGPAEMAC